MAAIDLNTIRKTIEDRISSEMKSTPPITVVFNNIPFQPLSDKTFVFSQIIFDQNEYITLGGTTNSNNLVRGQISLNIYTKVGVGIGQNLTVGTRLRSLFNRVILSGIYFEPPNGPNILQTAAPEGYFQSRITVDFQVVEQL